MVSPVKQFMANRSLACSLGYVATLSRSWVRKALSLDLVPSNCSVTVTLAVTRFASRSADYDYNDDDDRRRVS